MTTSPNTPEQPPIAGTRIASTALDAERIAAAVDAELAASIRETYACGWRQGERCDLGV
ncbi:hypothetical protein BN12_190015 [Nostocoides japonicum T1-X7]|uniref:Uncharacterized protein n=1 Tax=Nostocoides japonicum T1-X7 TaxID=1194083 RepID=A0A077LWY7_9MICO|nr:hypothetical protein [Tetrasphaera japonica]CCH77372.1 hypothetical protein BN12_190015 [Tetrasphaera japonica T1-X7]